MSKIHNDKSVEVIRHAAVKSVDGRIFFGKCHGDCFHKAHMMGVEMCSKADAQGFVTNLDRFLTRSEAAALALTNGQIEMGAPYLFSEDLWCEKDGGKFNHDEILGYVAR